MLVVTIPRLAEMFKSVIDEMTNWTDFKLINLLNAENENLTHKNLNTSIDCPENLWNIYLVSYDTSLSRAEPSSNGPLSYCAWSFGIFHESHQYKTKSSMGWKITMNVKMGFKLQVTATLGFHSLYDWCYQTTWLYSGVSDDSADNTVTEKHGAKALYSTVKGLIHAIRTANEEAQKDAVHQIIRIAKPWTIRRWMELKLPNEKPLILIPKESIHHIDLEWNENEQAKL